MIDVAAHDGRHRVDKHHLVVCDLALSANFELRLSLALGQLVLVLLLLGLSAGVLLLGGDLLILRVVYHNSLESVFKCWLGGKRVFRRCFKMINY